MNKVALLGRICKDIELRTGASGASYASFTLAVNRAYKKEGEERQADFINCKVFGKTAETMANYLSKGRQIAVEGKINTGSYEKDGVRIYTTDVIVDSFYFADSSKGESAISEKTGFIPFTDNNDDSLPF